MNKLQSLTENHLFWGDEMQYLVNALEWYQRFRVGQIKDIEKKGKAPLFTVNYIASMTDQLKNKLANFTRELQP